ncbi:putative uridine kinase C227.14 isoform X1 [Amborella trichopoda]|uniref:putative uridine kinase C227.14 isoform X1 n=1 Tax=Amborella trichopoda TaxID=13333 RepID=UPI0005D3B86F|nr:putative uridine kinase C227.14 isoform X1 [Amborella trichopoda]|eukprot:XP_011621604.1 putative uridine kinase C227.14 isoform X1 [Amborella trichopoda]
MEVALVSRSATRWPIACNRFQEESPCFDLSSSTGNLSYVKSTRAQWPRASPPFSLHVKETPLMRGQNGYLDRKRDPFKVFSSRTQEMTLLEARSMDEIYAALAERLLPSAATLSNPCSKYIVGVAGSPGSGKSTIASEVVDRLNKLWLQKAPRMDLLVEPTDVAIVVPMDGFHLYRSQLDAMEDPMEAHARRGAPWTFNPSRLLKCLNTLRREGSVYVPSFEHGVGDPIEDAVFVSPMHKIVIVEGNYLFLQDGVWKEISSLFDEKWFVDVDIDVAMRRVLKRHILKAGKAPDVAKWRVEYNDRPNAELIAKTKTYADIIIRSVELDN